MHTFSLICVNSELSKTSALDHNATQNMALTSYTHQSTSENIPPVRSAITGSAQKQLLQDNPSDPAIGHQRERVDGTSSRDGQAKQVSADTDGHASLQEGYHPARNHPARRVYDIPTLLRLKETQSAVPVMLRVKPEAIAGESTTVLLLQ